MKFYKSINLNCIKVLSFDLDNNIYDCQSVLSSAENWFSEYLTDKYNLMPFCKDYSFWAQIKKELLLQQPRLEDDVTLLRAKSLVIAFEYLKQPLKGGLEEAQSLVSEFIKKRSAGFVSAEVIQMLEKLKQKYRMISVSNGNLDTRILKVDHLFEYDLRPKMGVFKCKPYLDLFNECSRITKVSPHEILHIGDDPYTDVYGALSAGFNCAWLYKGYTGISNDERHLKVLPHIQLDNILELDSLL
ncbi:MAG: HAD-IA family hydrolase [Succinivibrio sp.]|nr:HAD-IA family hydrolase [Succinivibrio sp.]